MFGSKTREHKRRQEQEDLRRVARRVVLLYHQSWGQSAQEGIDALNAAVAAAGIKSVFEQPNEFSAGWRGPVFENERAIAFRKELDRGFPRGSFGAEESAVLSLIIRYHDRRLIREEVQP